MTENKSGREHGDTELKPNRLIGEKSPYLQQHAYNPVEWYPWGEEAFAKAREEGKPIFLSIGYSTCHWCHVMERESFEDPETARIMNDLFVNIKVDREERPDVDHVYMTAVQALTGSGGWPLSAWLTPELEPYYAGTYFPPRSAYGRPGFRDVLFSLHDAWSNQREKVDRSAKAIMSAVRQGSIVAQEPEETGPTVADAADLCYRQLERAYDTRHGGFSPAPKFPRPAIFEFLLRYYRERGEEKALRMTEHTIRRMASGGMYDQLGGGFARYSTDSEWRVPHFEKMLYDQGQLVGICADLYRITNDPFLETIIRQSVEYLVRDLMHESGAFYSAEDADSEGEEGTFYVWTVEELRRHLDDEELNGVMRYYGVTEAGNFEHGKNVLHTSAAPASVALDLGVSVARLMEILESARRKLFAVRSFRTRPHRDEKILTSWNGLMISGLARAASALGEPEFAALARRAADALTAVMNIDGRLMHRLKDGEVKFDGYLEDYAFLAQGLIDLYEATFEVRYLIEAERLVREADRLFVDEENGGYFMTGGEDPSVLVRFKSDHDGAEPAGNSVMVMNLLRIGRLFDDAGLLERGERALRLFLARIADAPVMMPQMVAAALQLERAPRQIVVAGSGDRDETERLVARVRSAYLPDTSLLYVGPEGPDERLAGRIEVLAGMKPVDGRAAVYLCENFTCRAPETDFVPPRAEPS